MLTVRPTLAEDLPALSALFEEGFGHPLAADEWEWKYRHLPGEGRSVVALGPAGELLAHAGALALPARWESGAGPAWQLCDFVGRRTSLRSPLVAAGRALLADLPRCGDMPWIFGFPSARHLALGERTFGYRPLPWVPVWEGELPAAGAGDGEVLATDDRCTGAAEPIWEACGGLGVRRSRAFLDWRYTARPRRYYRFYRLRVAATEGWVVAAFVHDLALLAEVWLPPGPDWYGALAAVAADLRAAGLRRWRCWPLRDGSTMLGRLGLAPGGEQVPMGCRPRAGAEPDEVVAAAARLYYPMGDHDVV